MSLIFNWFSSCWTCLRKSVEDTFVQLFLFFLPILPALNCVCIQRLLNLYSRIRLATLFAKHSQLAHTRNESIISLALANSKNMGMNRGANARIASICSTATAVLRASTANILRRYAHTLSRRFTSLSTAPPHTYTCYGTHQSR